MKAPTAVAALAVAAACDSTPIDIGSNAALTLDALVAARCTAAVSAVEPAPGSSPSTALVQGTALLTGEWAICPSNSVPPGLSAAFEISYGDGGTLTLVALRKASPNEYLLDAPLGDVAFDFSAPTETLTLTVGEGTTYLVTFVQPLRMSLASPARPGVPVAVYAAF